jgi:hypothetical protein
MKVVFEAVDTATLKIQILDFTKIFLGDVEIKPQTPQAPTKVYKTPGRKDGQTVAATRGTDPLDKAAQAELSLPIPPKKRGEAVTDTAPKLPEVKTDGFPVPTKEEVLESLKKLNDVKGLQAVKDVLARFGVERLTSLKEEHYGALYLDALTALK